MDSPAAPAPASDLAARLRAGQRFAFGQTWLVYVAFYLVRQNFSYAKPAMIADGFSKQDLRTLSMAYLVMYALGQFFTGMLGDRFGARKVILWSMGLAIATNVVFGFGSGIGFLSLLMALNGIAQAGGFPQCCKVLAAWFEPERRGRIVGLFLSSYTVGELIALVLTGLILRSANWQWAFFVPSALVAVALAYIAWSLRARPEDAGLPPLGGSAPPADADGGSKFGIEARRLLRMPALWVIMSSYFLLKLARYTFKDWSNVYLKEEYHYDPSDSTFAVILIPIGGLMGTMVATWLSDVVFQTRRAPVVVLFTLALAGFSVAFAKLAADPVAAVLLLGVIGFFAYGADAVISAASAMDLGDKEGASSAAGLINGVGSLGTVLSAVVGADLSTWLGWERAWMVLGGLLVISALVLSTRWNVAGKR